MGIMWDDECPRCGASFRTAGGLKTHIRMVGDECHLPVWQRKGHGWWGTAHLTMDEIREMAARKSAKEAKRPAAEYIGPDWVSYSEYIGTRHWQAKRRRALERAGNKCQICATTEALSVHHNTYERIGRERPTDLFVLCDECHDHAHLADWVVSAPEDVKLSKRLER